MSRRILPLVLLVVLISIAACAPVMQEVEKVAVKGWDVNNNKVYDLGEGKYKAFSNLEGVFPNHNIFVKCTIQAENPDATIPPPWEQQFPGYKIYWPKDGSSPFGVNFEFTGVATVTWEVWKGANDQGNLIFQKTDEIPKDEEVPKPFPTATRMP